MNEYFEPTSNDLFPLTKKLYDIWSNNPNNCLQTIFESLSFNGNNLTFEDRKYIKSVFYASNYNKFPNDIADELNGKDKDINKGIDYETRESKETKKIKKTKNNQDEIIIFIDIIQNIFRYVIPLFCIFTIKSNSMTFQDMLTYIKKKNNIKKMVETQLKMWWKKDDIIENIELIYNKYLTENKQLNIVIERVKQLLLNVKNDPVLFSKAIDTYLVPHEIEKKANAEFSTPHFLRQQMLDKIPVDFWSDVGIDFYSDKPIYPTVFEPCCGKGGFVVDIVNKLMVGLKAEIEDEEERYRVIVEECLYFADINPTNIFVCKLLLDPEDKYKLKYYEGNTLELDIEEQWGLEGFDAVIGNPPYNQYGRVGSGNTLW
jgi:hypothetical protein